jgi:hypothetical protein
MPKFDGTKRREIVQYGRRVRGCKGFRGTTLPKFRPYRAPLLGVAETAGGGGV